MRVLVTGGSGYLGSAIVRALVRQGHDPIVFARRASAAGLPGQAVDGDVRDRHAIMDWLLRAGLQWRAGDVLLQLRQHGREWNAVECVGLLRVLPA